LISIANLWSRKKPYICFNGFYQFTSRLVVFSLIYWLFLWLDYVFRHSSPNYPPLKTGVNRELSPWGKRTGDTTTENHHRVGRKGHLNLPQALLFTKQDVPELPSAGQNQPSGGKAGLPERPFPLTRPTEPHQSASCPPVPIKYLVGMGCPEVGGLEDRRRGGEGARSLPSLLIHQRRIKGLCRSVGFLLASVASIDRRPRQAALLRVKISHKLRLSFQGFWFGIVYLYISLDVIVKVRDKLSFFHE
jgi:hypothetical protein